MIVPIWKLVWSQSWGRTRDRISETLSRRYIDHNRSDQKKLLTLNYLAGNRYLFTYNMILAAWCIPSTVSRLVQHKLFQKIAFEHQYKKVPAYWARPCMWSRRIVSVPAVTICPCAGQWSIDDWNCKGDPVGPGLCTINCLIMMEDYVAWYWTATISPTMLWSKVDRLLP